LKVIFCLHHFLPEYIAGTEIYTYNLAKNLSDSGVQTLVLIPNFGNDETKEYEWQGLRVIKYGENSIEDRKMIMGKKKPDGLKEFVRIIGKEKPDIIHFHELAPGSGINIFHVEKAYELKIPIVLTFHLSYYTCFKGSLIYKDVEKCDGLIKIKRCTECVYFSKGITGIKGKVLSNAALSLYKTGINTMGLNNSVGTALGFPFVIDKIKKDLLRLASFSNKIVVLTEWYKEILEKNEVPTDKLVLIKQGLTNELKITSGNIHIRLPLKIVFIGRISELKGLHLLIDAVDTIPEEKISLDIYGQETGDDYATSCKQKSTLKNNIYWHGTISSDMVIPTLSQYHALCLPSTFSEMSPLVIQEAFAAGIPVIASDVYGNAEQIKDGINGWLFRFKDSNGLALRLQELINDPRKLESAKQNFPSATSFKEVAGKHFELYSKILGQ